MLSGCRFLSRLHHCGEAVPALSRPCRSFREGCFILIWRCPSSRQHWIDLGASNESHDFIGKHLPWLASRSTIPTTS